MSAESDMATDPPPVPAARLWSAWAVLVVAAAPLCLLALEAARFTLGPPPAFLRSSAGPVSTYDRLAYLVQTAAPDRLLLMSLLGLVAVTWLLRTSVAGWPEAEPVRRAATVLTAAVGVEAAGVALLAGYLFVAQQPVEGGMGFYGGSELEALAPPLLGGVLLLTLSALLLRELLTRAGLVAAVEDDAEVPPAQDGGSVARSRGDVPQARDGARELVAGAPGRSEPVVQEVDPHALYRRPG